MWTTMIARVRGVIRASTWDGSMFHVAGSESTRTGVAPALTIAAAQDTIVNVGTMTSSPGRMPQADTAASSAADPLATATPYLHPTRAANSFSKRSTKGPSDEIQPESMHSFRYFFSLPSKSGLFTGMKPSFIAGSSHQD